MIAEGAIAKFSWSGRLSKNLVCYVNRANEASGEYTLTVLSGNLKGHTITVPPKRLIKEDTAFILIPPADLNKWEPLALHGYLYAEVIRLREYLKVVCYTLPDKNYFSDHLNTYISRLDSLCFLAKESKEKRLNRIKEVLLLRQIVLRHRVLPGQKRLNPAVIRKLLKKTQFRRKENKKSVPPLFLGKSRYTYRLDDIDSAPRLFVKKRRTSPKKPAINVTTELLDIVKEGGLQQEEGKSQPGGST